MVDDKAVLTERLCNSSFSHRQGRMQNNALRILFVTRAVLPKIRNCLFRKECLYLGNVTLLKGQWLPAWGLFLSPWHCQVEQLSIMWVISCTLIWLRLLRSVGADAIIMQYTQNFLRKVLILVCPPFHTSNIVKTAGTAPPIIACWQSTIYCKHGILTMCL